MAIIKYNQPITAPKKNWRLTTSYESISYIRDTVSM
jgi:hypothetical protein